jgi:hypothetical protein
MRVQESLAEIHKPWISRISKSLARGEELRADFEELLDEFSNRMLQALNSGDPKIITNPQNTSRFRISQTVLSINRYGISRNPITIR